jgi:hypothetical protein
MCCQELSLLEQLHTRAHVAIFFLLLNTLLECEACVENAVHMIASLLGKLAHTVAIAILSYPYNTFGMQGILLRHHCLDSGLGQGHTSQFLSTRINLLPDSLSSSDECGSVPRSTLSRPS